MSKKDVEDLQSKFVQLQELYDRLLSEEGTENFDHRRLRFLKAQNIQLERQVALLSDCLHTRREIVVDIQNHALELQDLTSQGDAASLSQWAARVLTKLSRYETESTKALQRPYFMTTEFSNNYGSGKKRAGGGIGGPPTPAPTVSIYDVFVAGTHDHINVERVRQLEDSLNELYRSLYQMHSAVSRDLVPRLTTMEETRTKSQVQETVKSMSHILKELISLGMIVPTKRIATEDNLEMNPSAKELMNRLQPYITKTSKGEVQKIAQSLVNCFTAQQNLWQLHKETCEEEVKFHKESAEFQRKYFQDMLKAIEAAKTQFEKTVKEKLFSPLRDILEAFRMFDEEPSEENLRLFLSTFKELSPRIEAAVQEGRKQSFVETNYKAFQREVDIIQQEYNQKHDDHLSRKFKMEEEMLAEPLFMNTNAEIAATSPAHALSPTSSSPRPGTAASTASSVSMSSARPKKSGTTTKPSRMSLDNRPPFSLDFGGQPSQDDSPPPSRYHHGGDVNDDEPPPPPMPQSPPPQPAKKGSSVRSSSTGVKKKKPPANLDDRPPFSLDFEPTSSSIPAEDPPVSGGRQMVSESPRPAVPRKRSSSSVPSSEDASSVRSSSSSTLSRNPPPASHAPPPRRGAINADSESLSGRSSVSSDRSKPPSRPPPARGVSPAPQSSAHRDEDRELTKPVRKPPVPTRESLGGGGGGPSSNPLPLASYETDLKGDISKIQKRIQFLENELENDADLTSAQVFSIKKKIALEKAELVRQERALKFLRSG